MGLTQALGAAVSGLRTIETGLALVSANVANAQTPGYVRKTVTPETIASGNNMGVRVAGVARELDQYLQRQLRTETSGGAYADLKAQFYQRLQHVYGDPNSSTSLESVFNSFSAALQNLTADPADYSARTNLLSAAQTLTQQLNGLSTNIQGLRSDAEQGLADAVRSANEAIQGLASVNQQLSASQVQDAARAALLDQRDRYLDQLSELMDIRVNEGSSDEVNVFTSSGLQLVGTQASTLVFDAQGMMSPNAQWSADPTRRQVGTIVLANPGGAGMDLIQTKAFRSGRIAAYLEMRDQVLVQAQSQLDEFAAGMARALSDKTVSGTAVNPAPQSGFDIGTANLLAGNTIQVTYTDTLTNAAHTLTIVRVDDPNALPLAGTTTTGPNQMIGVDWSGGLASVVDQLNAAFGTLQFSNPAGATLRILNDTGATSSTVNAVSSTYTVSTLTGGSVEFPLFVDGDRLYTGAIMRAGPQSTGFAGRLAVNSALLDDPSKLIAFSATTSAGDAARPDFVYNQLTSASLTYSPSSGIGTAVSPFSGSLPSFLRQAMSQQGEAASAAQNLSEGQDMVVNALRQRFSDGTAVNIDEEMSNLLTLQTAYGANARVFTVVNDMIDTLMKM